VSAPTRATVAGRAYLDLRNIARASGRPVDELLQLYVLEAFLARLSASAYAQRLVLKGGVLLAAFQERRPTRDIDLQSDAVVSGIQDVLTMACDIAAIPLDDGVLFDTASATAETIREEDPYTGVRVTMTARLVTARQRFHVDVNVGDPILPEPESVAVPRLLGGELRLRGYTLATIYAEKIVTAIARGTVNTRWRDFADIYLLSRRHTIDGSTLAQSVEAVATYRQLALAPLAETLAGYDAIGQQRWSAWRRRQLLDDRLPTQFAEVISAVIHFADPAITGKARGRTWQPTNANWSP